MRGIDLALPRGGFLVVTGPNGSGKTTLLRICAGLAQPTEGAIERMAERAQVGYLGHEPLVYRELTALENLELYGRLYRVPERRERIGMVLEPIEPDEKPAVGSKAEPSDATMCPHLPLTKPRASPDALPPEIAALSVPWARLRPVPVIRNSPNR